jgi:hypothetical protein
VSQYVLINWKEECDAIHMEMDCLLTAGWPETAEERQVRKMQFMALIERRNVAAQNCLSSVGGRAIVSNSGHADSKFDVETKKVKISREPFEMPPVLDQTLRVLPDDPVFGREIANLKVAQEPSEVVPATDRSPRTLSEDMFEFDVMRVQLLNESSEAALAIDRGPHVPPMVDPPSALEIMSGNIAQELPEAAPEIDRRPQAPPTNPMFEAKTFLKFLGLK